MPRKRKAQVAALKAAYARRRHEDGRFIKNEQEQQSLSSLSRMRRDIAIFCVWYRTCRRENYE